MTTVRRINVSQIEGSNADNTDTSEIRPFGEAAFYIDQIGEGNRLTLMMFDGVRTHQKSKILSPGVLYGSNADSGDGGGYDTIKLIPDAALGTDQYIVVDPTGGEPGHIHLRAGGTQDASGADLYLGGEQTFVRVSDTNDTVTIRATQSGEGSLERNWVFDNIGQITFPDDTVQTTAWDGTFPTTLDASSITTINSPQVGFNITGAPFPEGSGVPWEFTWTSNGPVVTQLIAQGNNLVGTTVTQSEYPGTATVIGLVNLGGTLGIALDAAITYSPTNTLTFTSPDYAPSAPLPLDINVSDKTWTFGTNGSLSFPNDVQITLGGAMDMNSINITVPDSLNSETRHEWAFDASMGFPLLRFPDDTLQSTAWAGGRIVYAPLSSTGAEGDKERDLAFDNDHIYYCTADYTDGLSNIWKRVSWGGDTW